MLFAIQEINARQDLLPNTDLGYVIYDSCFTISKAVEGTLTYLTGQDVAVPNYRCGSGAPLAALVGAGGSDLSIATARILGLYHFPQVGRMCVRLYHSGILGVLAKNVNVNLLYLWICCWSIPPHH